MNSWFLFALFSGVCFGKAPRGDYLTNGEFPSRLHPAYVFFLRFALIATCCLVSEPPDWTGRAKGRRGEGEVRRRSLNSIRMLSHTRATAYGGSSGATWGFWGHQHGSLSAFSAAVGGGTGASRRSEGRGSQHSSSIPLTLQADSVTPGPRPPSPPDITGLCTTPVVPPGPAGVLQVRPDAPDVPRRPWMQTITPMGLIRTAAASIRPCKFALWLPQDLVLCHVIRFHVLCRARIRNQCDRLGALVNAPFQQLGGQL